MNSINITPENIEFKANDNIAQQIAILINGKEQNNGFRYHITNGDWFEMIPNANKFDIVVKENFDINDRTGYIVFHHNDMQGEAGEKVVSIVQKGAECNIKAIPDTVSFKNDGIDVRTIEVDVTGGNDKYHIQSFKKFDKTEKLIKNDKGIKIVKNNDNTLRITSYGRIFLNEKEHYEITLAHNNDRTKTVIITINYSIK